MNDNRNRQGKLPNLIVIGAMSCGTTSLHYYLNLHPEIAMSQPKELHFFLRELNWRKGVDWYRSHFTTNAKIYGETSPSYTCFPVFRGAPELIYRVVPHTKLIYLLRDPIERIISQYMKLYTEGKTDASLGEALACLDEDNIYVCRSQYYRQLEKYLRYFSDTQILIVRTEELQKERILTLQRIFRFLNVDPSFSCAKFSFIWHQSKYKRRKTRIGKYIEQSLAINIIQKLPFELRGVVEKLIYFPFSRSVKSPIMDETLRLKLVEYLYDDIRRLRAYTGYTLEEWTV